MNINLIMNIKSENDNNNSYNTTIHSIIISPQLYAVLAVLPLPSADA